MKLFDTVEGYVVYNAEEEEICTTFDELDIAKEEYPDAVYEPNEIFNMKQSSIMSVSDISDEFLDLLTLCKEKIIASKGQVIYDGLVATFSGLK